MSRRTPDLSDRLGALARALSIGATRLDPALLHPAEVVAEHAARRRGLAPERTVVALAGGTGSGKSSLFNALVGADLAPTGVRRPMTSRSRAALWPAPERDPGQASALLDWLDVPDRHDVTGGPATGGPVRGTRHLDLAGLLLIDLPDFDSTAAAHRLEAERLTQVVDLLVWVLDPQKYADAAVHERYLRPLATHAAAMLVVLNQVDRLDDAAGRECVRDLRTLLAADGLGAVPVLATSARTSQGVPELAAALAERVRGRAAALTRLHADIDAAIATLQPACAGSAARGGSEASHRRVGQRGDEELVRALGDAVGVGVIASAAGRSYRQRGTARTGWPLTRWLTRLRPDPLRRLHLAPGMSGPVSTARAEPGAPVAASKGAVDSTGRDAPGAGIVRAQLSNAVRDVVRERTVDLATPWQASAAAAVRAREPGLGAELDDAVRRADLSGSDRPWWWGAVHVVQLGLLAVAVVGLAWLGALAALGALALPRPTPHLGIVPIPTVALVAGLVAGALLALVCRPLIASGARRRARRARTSMDVNIRAVAQRSVLEPLTVELDAARDFCAALAQARR